MPYGGLQLPQDATPRTGYKGLGTKKYVPPPSTLSKVGGFAKDVAIDIGKTLTYTPQRLAQAGLALSGKTPEQQNRATQSVLGPLAIPVPTKTTLGEAGKEVGRAIQLPALALPVNTIKSALGAGAVFGTGQALESGDPFSKQGLTTAAATTAVTGAIPIVGKQLGKLFGKKAVPVEETLAKTEVRAPHTVPETVVPTVTKPAPLRGEVPPIEPGTIKISQVIENLKNTKVTVRQGTNILKELSQNNPSGNFTKAEIVKAFQNNLPQTTKGIMGNFKRGKIPPTESTGIVSPTMPVSTKVATETPLNIAPKTRVGEVAGGVPSSTYKQVSNISEAESSRAIESVQKTSGEVFDPKTVEESYKVFKETLSMDAKVAEDIATGRVTDPRINKSWALSWMENHADDIGDSKLAARLAQEDTFSIAGQELFGASLRQKDTTASIIREIRLDKLRKAGVGKTAKEAARNAKAEEASFLKTLKKELSDRTEDFIKVIKCK